MLFLIQAHWQGVMNFDLAISAKDNHQANNVTTERKVHVLCCVQYCCWPRIKPWECSLPSGLHCPPYGTNSTNWEHSTQLTYHSASAFAFGFSLSKLGRSATLYHCIVCHNFNFNWLKTIQNTIGKHSNKLVVSVILIRYWWDLVHQKKCLIWSLVTA